MRIVTWNCQQAFWKKSKAFFDTKPDIAIIQECAEKDAVGRRSTGIRICGSESTRRRVLPCSLRMVGA